MNTEEIRMIRNKIEYLGFVNLVVQEEYEIIEQRQDGNNGCSLWCKEGMVAFQK